MAIQYKIRAKDSITEDIYFVTIIGTFDPATDLNNPATGNSPEEGSVVIVSTTVIPEEFSLKDKYGIQAVAPYPSSLTAFDAVSHDFTDPTTWWQESTEITGEILTTSDNLTYNFSKFPVINKHKVIDTLKIPETKHLKIYIDGVEANHHDTNIISAIDSLNGSVTFASSQSGKTITADYAYVDNTKAERSRWRLTPGEGSVVAITSAKVKMSKNLVYNDTTIFNVGIDPFIIPGGIAAQRKYFSLRDFVGFSSRWEVLPAVGEYTGDIIHLLYEYQGSIVLDSALGQYAELYLENNNNHTGEIGLITFQCVKLKG